MALECALSSLEQVSSLLGWKLSATSKAIGVNDRSFMEGLSVLGLERGEILQNFMMPAFSQINDIYSKLSLVGQNGEKKLFLGIDNKNKHDYTPIEIVLESIVINTKNKESSVILFSDSKITFLGNPRVAKSLFDTLSEFPAERSYYKGDPNRMILWSMEGFNMSSGVVSKVISTLDEFYDRIDSKFEDKIANAFPNQKEKTDGFLKRVCRRIF